MTAQIPASALPQNSAALIEKILAQNPVHRKFLTASVAVLTAAETGQLDEYVGFCLAKGLTVDYLAESYLTIVMDTLREQVYFQKNGKYRHSSFAEVADAVYFDRDYMSHYMYGLALTSFLWPNHLAMFRFFRETLPRGKGGKYLEIGPGHGAYIMTAMETSGYDSFLGIDISETSVGQTNALIAWHRKGQAEKPYKIECMDFLQSDLPGGGFDAIVMGEVLEHVEQPEIFLRRIAALAKADTYIYITTCINAPAVDHIYLFESPEHLEKMFNACGLKIRNQLVRPYEGKTLEESQAARLAVNVAYVLEKA